MWRDIEATSDGLPRILTESEIKTHALGREERVVAAVARQDWHHAGVPAEP